MDGQPDGRAWVVLNLNSRRARRPGVSAEIERALLRHGVQVQVHHVTRPGEGARIARSAAEAGVPTVVAAGGDGTVNEVVQGLVGTQTALGVIPLGTGNALANNLGLAEGDIEGACKAIAAGNSQWLDVGLANSRYFVTMAGVGLDAQVVLDLSARSKTLLGKFAFAVRFPGTLFRQRPWRFRLRISGDQAVQVEEQLWAVAVCNMALYTWRLQFTPQARPDDGLLDVVAFPHRSRLALLAAVGRAFVNNQAPDDYQIMRWQAAEVVIEASPAAPWQVAGDVMGTTPVTIRACPRSIRVLKPAGSAVA